MAYTPTRLYQGQLPSQVHTASKGLEARNGADGALIAGPYLNTIQTWMMGRHDDETAERFHLRPGTASTGCRSLETYAHLIYERVP
jgi:hypothetical protein